MSDVELVRFVVLEVGNRSGMERGLLRASSRLQEAGLFSAAEEAFLKETFRFFNTHLLLPERVARANRRGAEPKAVSWFKPAASRFIARMQDLAAVLEAHGIHTRRLTTCTPGFVVYEDEYQVVAEAFRDRRQDYLRRNRDRAAGLSMPRVDDREPSFAGVRRLRGPPASMADRAV